jgi:hypothetical protein
MSRLEDRMRARARAYRSVATELYRLLHLLDCSWARDDDDLVGEEVERLRLHLNARASKIELKHGR